jgi:hypothetical protein
MGEPLVCHKVLTSTVKPPRESLSLSQG